MCHRQLLALIAIVLFRAPVAQSQDGNKSTKPLKEPSHVLGMEFLFDDAWIDQKSGVERVVVSPVKQPEPVLLPTEAWESQGVNHYSVLYDDEEGKFKVWYRATCDAAMNSPADTVEKPPKPPRTGGTLNLLCYGESADGVHWLRPELKRVKLPGKNNIVRPVGAGDTAFSSIVKDPADPDPQRRYKALGFDTAKRSNLRGRPQGGSGACVAFSPDGLAWTDPLLVMDTSDVTDSDRLFPQRDPATGRWTCFFRPRTVPKRRYVGYATSDDFEHWTYPSMLLTPDAGDNPSIEFYGLTAAAIGGWRVGAVWVFRNDPAFSPMTNELVFSRNGVDYHRAAPGHAFLPLGAPGSFDSRMVIPCAMIEHGDEVFVFYQGRNADHGSDRGRKTMTAPQTAAGEPARGGLGLARFPWGRFCGLRAADDGIVGTKWLANYGEGGVQAVADIGPEGSLKVEILDQFSRVIPGWSKDESRHRPGPHGSLTFYWNQEDLIGQAGQGKVGHVVKLRFHLRNATLYGYRVGAPGSAPAYEGAG